MPRKMLYIHFAFILSIVSSLFAQPSASGVRAIYHSNYEQRLVPLLTEIIRFPTIAGNTEAAKGQREWLKRLATELGLIFRDTGTMAEVELPGPNAGPVLGLITHGDVIIPGEGWSTPPFEVRYSLSWT